MRGLSRYSKYRDETPHFRDFDRVDGDPHMTDGRGEVVFVPGGGKMKWVPI